jgi:hypothetical protein
MGAGKPFTQQAYRRKRENKIAKRGAANDENPLQ